MISGNGTRVSRIARLAVEMNHITDIDRSGTV
jgi:hypothetical protein